jgi:hypothetical protein
LQDENKALSEAAEDRNLYWRDLGHAFSLGQLFLFSVNLWLIVNYSCYLLGGNRKRTQNGCLAGKSNL